MSGLRGSFNDGRSAERVDVEVSLEAAGLRLTDEAGREVALWPYETLRQLDEAFGDGPLRLKASVAEGARLTLPDAALWAELAQRAPQLVLRKRGWLLHGLGWVAATILAVPVLVWLVWQAVPGFARVATKAVPISWEVALGEQMMGQVVAIFAQFEGKEEVRFCEAAAGRRVLDELTGRLSRAAASPYEFRVSVMDLDVPNAFALPGGRIVLFRGLIDFAESADEVAGVLAHEMGHVTHRHGTEGIVKSLGLGFFFGVLLGDLGSGIIGLAGETLVSTAFSREAETEADGAALELLDRAGLGAEGVSDFFARLQETYGDMPGAMALLSTHPTNESRAQRFAGRSGAPALSAADWQALQEICGE